MILLLLLKTFYFFIFNKNGTNFAATFWANF